MIVSLMKNRFTPRPRLTDYLVAIVLVLVPFQAFLTIWGSTLLGHYTLLRLWDDAVLTVLLGVASFWLAKDVALRQWFLGSTLVRLILAYTALSILLGFVSLIKTEVTPKALAYGLLVNTRFLLWFLAVFLVAQRSMFLKRASLDLLFLPTLIVVIFACLQYTVLPHNFLAHFGYSQATIAPIETINHNNHYIRVQSTLRGANPLGAYLVVILSAVSVPFARGRYRILSGILGVMALFALYASGSRSAWIGVVLSLFAIGWIRIKNKQTRLYFGAASLALILVLAGGYVALRNNAHIQNELLHTQAHSVSKVSSNAAHASALKDGIKDVIHQPLGDGPGTAGPASEYNTPHPVRIAENYYVQIAQETGWLGLALFLGILLLVVRELYERANGSQFALALFAALIGVSFVNLLSHAWTDDTLAYVWWGLAGITLGSVVPKGQKEVGAGHV